MSVGASIIADNTVMETEAFALTANRSSGATIVRNTVYVENATSTCIRSNGANRIEENSCHGGGAGLVLTDGANFYARNFIYGAVVPVVDGGGDNIDGGTIDLALSNVIVR